MGKTVSNMLGLGIVSDRISRKGRVVVLSIQRLGRFTVEVIDNEIVYPKGKQLTLGLKLRIENYLL